MKNLTNCVDPVCQSTHLGVSHIQRVNDEIAPPRADPEGGTGGTDPLCKTTKNIGFLSNTGLDSLKRYKASSHCWAIIGPPVGHHLNGVSLAG